MIMQNKHKLNFLKTIRFFGAFLLAAFGAILVSSTPVSAASSPERYSSANHTFTGLNKDKVYSIDCTMQIIGYDKFALEYNHYEWITVANLNRTDTPVSYTYAPNYAQMSEDENGYWTTQPTLDLANKPKQAVTCHEIFAEFSKNYDKANEFAPYGNCPTAANEFFEGRCTWIRTGYENPGNQIFSDGDVTFAGSKNQIVVNVPFMYAYLSGSSAYINAQDESTARQKKEPVTEYDASGNKKDEGTPTSHIIDLCVKVNDTTCETVGHREEIEVRDKTPGSGEPYTYNLKIFVTDHIDAFRRNEIHLTYRICPPYIPSASVDSIVCVQEERHGFGGILINNTATKAALLEMFAASTPSPDCYSSAGTLGFMSCETINKTENFIEKGYSAVADKFLVFKLEPAAKTALEDATKRTATVANAFLGVVLVIIILSQVSGIGISNYGIKAMLPRLCVYAVLVNVSFMLCAMFVDIASILSEFLKDVFAANAGSQNGSMVAIAAVTGAVAVIAAVADTAIVIPALIGLIGIAIGVIFIIVLLAVRQALIIFLIAVSPLAFMCNVLPNTRSIFQKWWGLFKGAIIAYPVLTGVVYGGAYAADLYLKSGGGGSGIENMLHNLMGAAIAIAPVFAAPSILQGSLGAINQMVGSAKNKLTGMAKGTAARKLPNGRLTGRIANRADRQKAARDSRTAFKASQTQHGIDQKTLEKVGDKMAKGTATEKDLNKFRLATQREAHRASSNAAMAEQYVAGMTPDQMQNWIRDNRSTASSETMGAMQNAMMRNLASSGNTQAIENMNWDTSRMSQQDRQTFNTTRASAMKSSGDVIGALAGKYNAANGTTFGDNFVNSLNNSELSNLLGKEGPDVLTKLASNPEAFDRFIGQLNAGGRQLEDVAPPEAMQHLMMNSNKLSPQSLAHVQGALKRMATPDASGNYSDSYKKVMSNVSAKDLTGIHADILKDHLDNGMLDHAVTEYTVGNGKEYQGHTNEAQDNQIWKRSSTMGGGPSNP